jgi:hypothetical protein
LLLLDGQVHHDTHVIPMGNYVSEVGNYLSARPSDLGNYVSADTWMSAAKAVGCVPVGVLGWTG